MSVTEIGRRLKNARLNAHMTQADVAKYLGITYQAISNYERGITRVDVETLGKLCQFYGIQIGDLLHTPAWDESMFESYRNAPSDEVRQMYLRDWGVPSELMEEINEKREPDRSPLAAMDQKILHAYYHVDEDMRSVINGCLGLTAPPPSFPLTPGETALVLSYRRADDRTRQMVDLALEPYKTPAQSEAAM